MERDGGKLAGRQVVTENPAKWTSRHGSLVVTALNAGTPDGMNERGLAVHGLWLNATDYGPRDTTKAGLEVARDGVEPSTFRFSVGRSYQLSYLAQQSKASFR